jgi:hypothetical protein
MPCVTLTALQSNLQRFVCAVLHVSGRIWCLYDNDKFTRSADLSFAARVTLLSVNLLAPEFF